MKTKKCKVAVYDCKKHRIVIEEREMPIYEETPPIPSQLETVLYHLCKLMDPPDSVLDEFVKHYESTYGETYKPTVKFVTESELEQKLGIVNKLSTKSISASKKGSIYNGNTHQSTYYVKLLECSGIAVLNVDMSIHNVFSGISGRTSLTLFAGYGVVSIGAGGRFNNKITVVIPSELKAKITVAGECQAKYNINISGTLLEIK